MIGKPGRKGDLRLKAEEVDGEHRSASGNRLDERRCGGEAGNTQAFGAKFILRGSLDLHASGMMAGVFIGVNQRKLLSPQKSEQEQR